MKKHLLLLIFVFFIEHLLNAQITITQADIAPIGGVIYRGIDTSYTNVPIGAGGTGMNWNFSSLVIDKKDTLSFVTASSLPNYSAFPSSNLGVVLTGKGTAYTVLNATALKIIGLSGTVQGIPVVARLNPAETTVKFPSSYGNTYRDSSITYAGPISYTAQPGVDSVRYKSTKVKQVSIDAWGTLTVPFGTFNVIRQKEIITQNDIIDVHSISLPFFPGTWSNFQNTTRNSTHYSYWANGLGYPLMEADSLSSGRVNITWILQTPPAGVSEQADEGNSIIYPNPAKSNLFIKLQNSRATIIEITDMLGRQVKSMNCQDTITSIYVGDLSKGMYIYKITYWDGKLESGKFIVESDF